MSITNFTEIIKKNEEWSKNGLLEKIIRFLVETDQVWIFY